MKNLAYLGGLFWALFLWSCASQRVVVSYGPQEINTALDSTSYQFVARFVQPASGRMRNLTGATYYLRVTKDKVSADLPYFGRAYSAPIGGDGGIKFEAADFTYDEAIKKKGRREIRIRVHNSPVVRELFLTVFPDGSADLQVTPSSRQFISYRGEVTPMVN